LLNCLEEIFGPLETFLAIQQFDNTTISEAPEHPALKHSLS
jgi:hypothetical protein